MKNALDINFIIDNGLNEPDDTRLFGLTPAIHLPDTATMFDILATAGIFSSKSEARKNWRGVVEIPKGFSQFEVGKLKHQITILNPHVWEFLPNRLDKVD
jgi:hypothetical protein